jgi:hypothetical protein
MRRSVRPLSVRYETDDYTREPKPRKRDFSLISLENAKN